jgi:putative transposase
LVESAHYDAANFLLRRYDVLILPKLSTGCMVQKDSRVFGSKVARSMCTMSHGLFSQRVASAAARYPGRHVITDSGEPGTSKTCSNCGHFDASLGASKVYTCPNPSCGVCVDRDVNGWRGNLFAAYGKAVGVGWDGRGD